MIPMLVLASASPRRQELLRSAGILFDVQPSHVAEDILPGEGARECAERLAREKALAVACQRAHQVITGVCLVAGGQSSVASETTLVTVSEITDQEIADYVASGEPMDKAGAYAIQGIASRWIPRVEGDYSNVVGLPIALVWRMLRQAGIV